MPPIEVIEKRTRNSKTHSLGGRKYSWDGTIGSIHYEDGGWQEIDSYFEPAIAPWSWQMLGAGYHIRVKEDFTAGQIIEFEKQGEAVQFQPMALEWTNDLDQIQQISMPQDVVPTITNPEIDLLPAVGMPSHCGTIRWDDGYGEGIDFEWRCTSTRLVKILEIENLNKLPVPEQYIIDGGNPVLRLNLIFAPSGGTDIYIDDELWDKKAKKQTFNIIEFRKDGEVLWGFMPLRYWGSNPEAEDNEGQSAATLEKRGNKLYISIRVPYDWLQSATYPVMIDTDVDEVVGASLDDAHERVSSGAMTTTTDYVDIGSRYYPCDGGFRFQTVAIDQGATITTAYAQFYAYYNDTGAVSFTWYCEDIDDAPAFTADAFNISGRDTTTASVNENPPESWDDNEWEPGFTGDWVEIKTLIKEVVDRGGWNSGQDIVLINIYVEGSGERVASSYDRGAEFGAKLHIEWEAVGGEEKGPISSAVIIGNLVSATKALAMDRDSSVIVGNLVSASRAIVITRASSVILGVKVTASRIRDKMVTSSVIVGIVATASRAIAITRSASVSLGNLVSASRAIAMTRAASTLIGNLVSASRIYGPVRVASIIVGNLVSASRALTITRASSVIVGIVVSASRLLGIVRTASVSIGILVSASRIGGVIRSASVIIGELVSASRVVAYIRSASVLIGNLVSASRIRGVIKSASVSIGVLVSALRLFGYSFTAAVVVGVIASASRAAGHTIASLIIIGVRVTARIRRILVHILKPPAIHDLGRIKAHYTLGRSLFNYTIGKVRKGYHNLGRKVK